MKQISAYTRPRPVIELEGTPFYVDAQWLYLVQVGNPKTGSTCMRHVPLRIT